MTASCAFCLSDEVSVLLTSKTEGVYICYECALAACWQARAYFAGEIEYRSWLP